MRDYDEGEEDLRDAATAVAFVAILFAAGLAAYAVWAW